MDGLRSMMATILGCLGAEDGAFINTTDLYGWLDYQDMELQDSCISSRRSHRSDTTSYYGDKLSKSLIP